MAVVRYEQAVYGSFPFWDKGYALLAHSPGCRSEWLAEFQQACRNYGEPPPGMTVSGAMFALRLPSGPWVVVGVSSERADDHGRPTPLVFHGLFVEHQILRASRLGPFAMLPALRSDWGPDVNALPAGDCPLTGAQITSGPDPLHRVPQIARALNRRRRIALEAAEPITETARAVWSHLDRHVRGRCSIATMAFSTANRFDLAAYPKLSGLDLGPSYLTAEALDETSLNRTDRHRVALHATLGGVFGLVLLLAILGLLLRRAFDRPRSVEALAVTPQPPGTIVARVATSSWTAPARPVSPDERALVIEGLRDLAERGGIAQDIVTSAEVPELLEAITTALRYPGPWLSEQQVQELRQLDHPEARRVLEWHEHLRAHFAGARSMPPEVASAVLSSQLNLLVSNWSLQLPSELSLPEVPFAIAEALAPPCSTRPSPLADRYPPLADYARFLARLPKR